MDAWMCWRLYAKRRTSLESLHSTLSIDDVYEANLVEDLLDNAKQDAIAKAKGKIK